MWHRCRTHMTQRNGNFPGTDLAKSHLERGTVLGTGAVPGRHMCLALAVKRHLEQPGNSWIQVGLPGNGTT